uniref:Candidate secreted effector n=1 Tax=Meloidogyne incognita TaxID=6306 RepID=A0A914MSH5_MELIC
MLLNSINTYFVNFNPTSNYISSSLSERIIKSFIFFGNSLTNSISIKNISVVNVILLKIHISSCTRNILKDVKL